MFNGQWSSRGGSRSARSSRGIDDDIHNHTEIE